MGLRMDDIHTPTVPSGPTTDGPSANGAEQHATLKELMNQKERVEEELKALGEVLDSVRRRFQIKNKVTVG